MPTGGDDLVHALNGTQHATHCHAASLDTFTPSTLRLQ